MYCQHQINNYQITNKYQQSTINTLNYFGLFNPDNSPEILQFNQILEFIVYSKLIKHISQIELKFLSSIFIQLNQNFDYHYIDSIQANSNINNNS
ncbi:unnamed protein product [Paramecium pentaurelia]|nr:unnamed protein product [Paramecium pentaurelia]